MLNPSLRLVYDAIRRIYDATRARRDATRDAAYDAIRRIYDAALQVKCFFTGGLRRDTTHLRRERDATRRDATPEARGGSGRLRETLGGSRGFGTGSVELAGGSGRPREISGQAPGSLQEARGAPGMAPGGSRSGSGGLPQRLRGAGGFGTGSGELYE